MPIQDDEIIGFEPDSDGYDYQTALDAGYKADESGHWSSIDERTGMVLKGRNHPTWDKTVEAETKLGNTIIKGDNGRYYSVKMPKFMSDPIIEDNQFQDDNPVSAIEQAAKDYDFAINNNITLGALDAFKREWATASGLKKKIPFAGGILAAEENLKLRAAAKRVQNPALYEQKWNEFVLDSGGATIGDTSALYGIDKQKWIEDYKKRDKEAVGAFLEYITANKTAMHKIISGVSQLPSFMAEFAATGGLASLGKATATKAGEKLIGEYAKTTAGKIILKAAGFTGGAVARGTLGLGNRTLETMTQRQLDVVLNLREEENWATSALIAWGDTVIEAASESAGEGLTKAGGMVLNKLPFGSKLTSALEKAWITATGGTKGEFVRKMFSKGGYSNILGEIGEERLGTALRAITAVDDFGLGKNASMIERLQAGILQDWENIGVELGVLSVPAGGQVVLGQIVKQPEADFDSTKFDQTPVADTQIPTMPVADIKPPVQEPQKQPEKQQEISVESTEPKFITIENANTAKEVNQVVQQIITKGTARPETSARQEDLQGDRAALGLDGIASAERKSWQKSLQQAKDLNLIDTALRTSAEVNANPRALNDIETAGLVMKAAQLKKEHKDLMSQIDKAKEGENLSDLSAKIDVIEKEFDTVTQALYKSGTEKGRALASQKLTINQDFDLLSLKNRAKKIKGRELTEAENKKIEQLSKDLELQQAENEILKKKINEMMAKTFVRQGSIRKYSRMSRTDINTELNALISRTQQLLEEGCLN
jgi:hypothetical protein